MPSGRADSGLRAAVPAAAVELEDYAVLHEGTAVPSLGPVTLGIEPGERVLLLGPSGSGKSTLLAALAGVLTSPEADDGVHESGRVRVDGRHPAEAKGRAGLMQQDPEAQVIMATVGRDVAFGPENLAVPREEIARRVPEALEAVGLGGLSLERSTGQLSGGQKQRVGLAGLLAMEPGLILLDEPTANLDPAGAAEVVAAVDESCRRTGASLVVVEHRLEAWAAVCERCVVLAPGGGVLADGPVGEVLAEGSPLRPRLREAGVWLPGETPRVRVGPPETPAAPSGERRPAEARHQAPQPEAPVSAAPLLEARGLAVTRDPKRRWALRRADRAPRRAVQSGVDLEVRPGEALAVMGPNGAGKTTLALTLAGLLDPLEGEVAAGPQLAAGLREPSPHAWRAPQLIRRIGTVFQNPEHQFVTSSVRAELEHGPRLAGLDEEEVSRRADALLASLGLADRADQQPFTLSGGQKRRLSVASALAAAPDVLVIDEPTFGQDALTWGELASLVNELLREGRAVVAVTHDEEFAEAVNARIVRMEVQP